MRSPGTAAASIVRWRFAARSLVDCTVAREARLADTVTVTPARDSPSTTASTCVPDDARGREDARAPSGAQSARAAPAADEREGEGAPSGDAHGSVAVRTSNESRASFE